MRDQKIKKRFTPSSRRSGSAVREPARFGIQRSESRRQQQAPGIRCRALGYFDQWINRLDPARRGERAACELAEIVARSNDANELRRALVRIACRMARADRAELFREHEPGLSPRRVAVWPEAARPLAPGVEDATTVSLIDEICDLSRAPIGESGAVPIVREDVDELRMPIVVGGRPWGELRIVIGKRRPRLWTRPRRWSTGLIRPLESLCAFVAGVEISMNSILEPAPADPTRDPLTGRPNGAFLINALPLLLSYAQRRREPLALLHIVADKLDVVREVQGPSIADALLRRLSHAVSATLRAGDLVARLDEPDSFVAVLAGAPLADASGVVVEALRRAVAEAGITSAFPLSVSIGIAAFPEHGHDSASLLSLARDACRNAQSLGPGQIAVAPLADECSTFSQNTLRAVPSNPRGRTTSSHSYVSPNLHSSAAVTKIAR